LHRILIFLCRHDDYFIFCNAVSNLLINLLNLTMLMVTKYNELYALN
jgi:hypothetical protein